MKAGDLVYVCPGDPTVGVIVGPDSQFSERTRVLFDGLIYSVPTFQLEVVSDEVISEGR